MIEWMDGLTVDNTDDKSKPLPSVPSHSDVKPETRAIVLCAIKRDPWSPA